MMQSWKSVSGLIQDPQLTMEESQMAIANPEHTKEVILEGTGSMVDWIKATIRSVYPQKGDSPPPPISAKWNTPDEAADMLDIQTTLD